MKIEKIIAACKDISVLVSPEIPISDNKKQMKFDLLEASEALTEDDLSNLKESTISVLKKLKIKNEEKNEASKKELVNFVNDNKLEEKGEEVKRIKEKVKEPNTKKDSSKKAIKKRDIKKEKENKVSAVKERALAFVKIIKHAGKKGVSKSDIVLSMNKECHGGERNVAYSVKNFVEVCLMLGVISCDNNGLLHSCQ